MTMILIHIINLTNFHSLITESAGNVKVIYSEITGEIDKITAIR